MKATRWSKRKRERGREGEREREREGKASTEKRLAPSLSNDYPG
jgi:hypothetical protein